MTHTAVLYTKEGCCLCDRAKEVLRRLQGEFDLEIEEVDITRDGVLYEQYQYVIPVVVIDGKHRFESKIAEYYLRRVLATRRADISAGPYMEDRAGRAWHGEAVPRNPYMGPKTRRVVRAAQIGSFWFARHWLALANGINLLVLAGSALVPAMRAVGLYSLADPLFGSYRLVCHQLPYRSFYLFGHPMAMCQRNVAIYASMALAGLAFALVRDRLRPLPWRWYLVFLLPIAIDGFTQLLGLRESNWQLRLLTGSLFGVASVWLAYPYIHRFAQDILAYPSSSRVGATASRPGAGPGTGRLPVAPTGVENVGSLPGKVTGTRYPGAER